MIGIDLFPFETNSVRQAYCLMLNTDSSFCGVGLVHGTFQETLRSSADRRRRFGGLRPRGRFEAEQHDRYASFVEARDAALSSIEIMLDEADYDGEDHREELEQMLGLLDSSSSYEELERHPEYQRVLERLDPVRSFAA